MRGMENEAIMEVNMSTKATAREIVIPELAERTRNWPGG
jgi:hypothetical protein